jgi:hypothetical protein
MATVTLNTAEDLIAFLDSTIWRVMRRGTPKIEGVYSKNQVDIAREVFIARRERAITLKKLKVPPDLTIRPPKSFISRQPVYEWAPAPDFMSRSELVRRYGNIDQPLYGGLRIGYPAYYDIPVQDKDGVYRILRVTSHEYGNLVKLGRATGKLPTPSGLARSLVSGVLSLAAVIPGPWQLPALVASTAMSTNGLKGS